jgi:hypothetical protein
MLPALHAAAQPLTGGQAGRYTDPLVAEPYRGS